jgi:SNF2 family DNA or RNA helicase
VLDLPPKLYSKRYFDLTPEQQRVYVEIKTEALTLLDTGDVVTAPLIITRLLRMQQVTCGYVPTDDGHVEQMIGDKNPRLDTLVELCEGLAHPAIIWAKFRKDIDLIMEKLGDKAVRYDGQTSDDERAEAKRRFQTGDVQFFVANPAAGSTGLTLTAARTVIYYNNSFKLVDRLQSEDRAHRAGQTFPVDYIDIVAPNTVDVAIVNALRSKVNIAAEITGDNLKEWL